jgi:hypothetical protein
MASIPLHGMKVQSDAQRKLTHNPKVASSNLTPATIIKTYPRIGLRNE